MRYKVTLAYNGNNYVGFQSQPNGSTIQDNIEKALKEIFHEDIRIIMASRTDAKVHAYGQVFHFDTDKEMDPYRLKGALNSLTNKDIHVIKAEVVSQNFHARFNVKNKTYKYLINIGEYDVFSGKRQRVRRALNRPARERLRDMNHRIAVIHLFAQANGFVRRAQIRHALEKRGNDRAFGKVFSIRAP